VATAREITTVMDFSLQDAGLKEYQRTVTSTLDKVKSQLTTISRMFGATLALDFGKEAFMGLVNAVGAARKLGVQLGQILEPGTDVVEVTDRLFEIAQDLGASYAEVGGHFKMMAASAKEFGVDQDTTMEAMNNISKALEVSRASGEETEQTFNRINMALRRGELSVRTLGELLQSAPVVARTLGDALGKTEAELRAMADAGKLTSDVLLKAFAKDNPLLQGEFEAKANTLGESFERIYNVLIKVGVALWKGTGGMAKIADAIDKVTYAVVKFGSRAVKAFGGVERVLRYLQIIIGIVFSYYTISMIIAVTKAIVGLGSAAALASLKFMAIVAAIGLIAVAIEDFIVWMEGGESVIGDMIGPFDELNEKLAPLYKSLEQLAAPFKALWELMTGNPGAALNTLKDAFLSVQGPADALNVTVGAIGAVWLAWTTMSKFAGLLSAIGGVGSGLAEVVGATGKTKEAVAGVQSAFTALNNTKLAGLVATLAPTGPLMLAIVAVGAAVLLIAANWDEVKKAGEQAITQVALTANRLKQVVTDFMEGRNTNPPRKEGEIPQYPVQKFTPGGAWKPTDQPAEKPGGAWAVPPDAPVTTPGGAWAPPNVNDTRSWWQRTMPSIVGGTNVMPNVTPAAVAATQPVVTNETNNNVPINNTVNVTVPAEFGELEARIRNITDTSMTRLAEDVSRQLTRAAPAMEARPGG
jgi:tape measure domain-containing protein